MSDVFFGYQGFPLLSVMLALPPLGALMAALSHTPAQARLIALGTGAASLLLALIVLAGFDASSTDFQWVERYDWIPTLHIAYHVGVDGISAPFLPLTSLLFLGVILASWTSVQTMPKLYYILLLLLEGITLGVFVSLDVILFFLFWEMTLIPIFFLISFWGVGPYRRYAATQYTLFMLGGGAFLLMAFALLAVSQAGTGPDALQHLTFDYTRLLESDLDPGIQTAVFFLLLLGFAAKTPVFPLHTWLPTLAMEGSTGIAALMAGLKLGAFGMIRFLMPLAPQAAQEYHWLLTGLGVIGLIYGAFMALSQNNLRRMLAYASLSHVGLVLLGISSQNVSGLQGALFQLCNFTIVAGGLFILTGFLHHRTGSTNTIHLGGGAKSMPLLSAFFLLLGMASLGVPGTNGFPAEFLILMSALETHTGAGLASLAAMILGAAYFLGMFKKTFFGPVRSPVVEGAMDLRPRELAVASALGFMVLLFGLFPSLILDLTKASATAWASRFLF